MDKKDSDFDEILDDLFRIGAENLRRIGQEKVQNGCDDDTSRDTNHESDDDGNIYDISDITIEDVEQIRQFLTPNVPNEMDEVIQPSISQPIHTTPPNDDCVALATKLILDELLEEFGDEILNVIMVDDEANFNPTKDIEELERILAKDPQSHFTEIQIYAFGISLSFSFTSKCTWSGVSCKKASQTRLVGCYTCDEEVACNGGCCSRKQTWSMA
ncbi:hypothetical protein Tco_0504669 [Tanacetum coccineum]